MTSLREATFVVLVGTYLVCAQTILFRLIPGLTVLGNILRIVLPIVLLLVFRRLALSPKVTPVMLAYAATVAYFALQVATSGFTTDGILYTSKFVSVVFLFFALALVLHPRNVSTRFLLAACVTGGLLALQSASLLTLLALHWKIPLVELPAGNWGTGTIRAFGYWGLASSIRALGTEHELVRAQSFFLEPTNFANFLEPAIFLSYGFYKTKGWRWMKYNALICLIVFVATFSITGFLCMLITLAIGYGTRRVARWRHLMGVKVAFWLGLGVVGAAVYLKVVADPEFYGAGRVGMGFARPPSEFQERWNFVRDSFELFWRAPWGIGVPYPGASPLLDIFAGARESRMAPLLWLVMQGVVGIFLQAYIVGRALRTALVQATRTGSIERYLGLSFICYTGHQCLGGDWFDAMFIFLLISVLSMDAWRIARPAGHATKPVPVGGV